MTIEIKDMKTNEYLTLEIFICMYYFVVISTFSSSDVNFTCE